MQNRITTRIYNVKKERKYQDRRTQKNYQTPYQFFLNFKFKKEEVMAAF